MFLPLTVIDTIASALMLAVGGSVIFILVKIERRVKRSRKTMYPYVVLYRGSGDAVPVGTYAVRDQAMKAVDQLVRQETGLMPGEEVPPAVNSRFNEDHSSWRGKNIMGNRVHVWMAEIKFN